MATVTVRFLRKRRPTDKVDKPAQKKNLGNKKGRMSSSDSDPDSSGPCRIRTYDRLIKSQLQNFDNPSTENDLQDRQPPAYKPAYKNESERDTNDSDGIRDLGQLIQAWDRLPEHIRKTIQVLIEINSGDEGSMNA